MPNFKTSQSYAQGLSRAPNVNSDNNATVPQVVPVTSGGAVYYLNSCSGRAIFRNLMPPNVCSTALVKIEVPDVVPTESIATL